MTYTKTMEQTAPVDEQTAATAAPAVPPRKTAAASATSGTLTGSLDDADVAPAGGGRGESDGLSAAKEMDGPLYPPVELPVASAPLPVEPPPANFSVLNK